MGFNISCLACLNSDKDKLLAVLKLRETDRGDQEYEAPLSYGALGDNYLVWQNWRAGPPFDEDQLAKASEACPILCCFISEATMWSQVAYFLEGRVSWSLSHTSEKASDDIKANGPVPKIWNNIVAELRQSANADDADREVDYLFDAAPLLFKHLTDFKYDEVPELGFKELEYDGSAGKKPFWKVWK
jgi:hypothetical protein